MKHLNKKLKNINNRISSVDKITWRTFYEMYTPQDTEDLETDEIYSKLGTTKENNTSKININGRETTLVEIYKIISKII